jgi:hypothetical protein
MVREAEPASTDSDGHHCFKHNFHTIIAQLPVRFKLRHELTMLRKMAPFPGATGSFGTVKFLLPQPDQSHCESLYYLSDLVQALACE